MSIFIKPLSKDLFVSLNNHQCIARPMLIDWNPGELHYYPFIVSLDRYDPFASAPVAN